MAALLFLLAMALPSLAVAADIVSITKAQYDADKQELRIEATSTDASATLTVHVTATNETIGTLTNKGGGKSNGQFKWPVNPGRVTVRSSSGGSAGFEFSSPPPAATPDFLVSIGQGGLDGGFLVRGGFPVCPDYYRCFGGMLLDPGPGWEPRTLFNPEIGFVGYFSSQVTVISRNDFAGTVALEVLNLPPGVTSQTGVSVTVAPNSGASTPFMLLAADDAPLGDHVVAVRATSGALVNEGSFTIRIVDRLPAPPPGVSMDTGLATPVVGGGQYGARVTISAPAPEDLTVFLSVEGVSPGEPAVVNVPASITIPLGARSASFAVTTPTVTTTVGQSVRGKIGADGWLGATPLTVVPSAALSQVVLSPTSVVGGESSAVNVHLSAAVAEATVVSLSSSNPDVATPPATVTVPAGSASTFAPVPTQAVATDTSIGISATFGGVTKTAFLGVTAEAPPSPPPGGAITVKSAQYDTGKNILQVEVNDSRALAQIITVFVTSTNETIGTLTSTFKGQFAWPVNPQKITIASSAGWSMTGVTVQAK